MKKSMTMGAMAIALLAAVGCSERETDLNTTPGGDGDQVALSITPNLKVDADSKAATKSVVSGAAITYDIAQYTNSDYAPGLGVLITNTDATGWYVPTDMSYKQHHLWYMGDALGANWKSIFEKGENFDTTSESAYYLQAAVGRVYAYYPYNKDLEKTLTTITGESDLKIPVSVLKNGTIAATISNASKVWDTDKGDWSDNTPNANKVLLADALEKDFLYFDAGLTGRYVNNGRTPGSSTIGPNDKSDNTNATNPGYKILLNMKHAMSIVTFRVYDGDNLSRNNVHFTKFQIKNAESSTAKPFKMGTGYVSLVDGQITANVQENGDISRTVSDYILKRDQKGAGMENEYEFIEHVVNGVNAKSVSKSVSAIVYPTGPFGKDDIQVLVTLKEGAMEEIVLPVTLPANTWKAGNNYIYTLSAGSNNLMVTDVTVEAWIDNEQETIPM